MRLKKKVKRFLILFLILIILIVGGILGYPKVKELLNKKNTPKEIKIINKIDKYGYNLRENKSDKYKKMFDELKTILNEESVDEEQYVTKISEMFIYDFYSLSNKLAKTDVGGVDFVYNEILENFIENAEDTYYKYVESNIYNNRKQNLPTVEDISIASIDKKEFKYGDKTDPEAYVINISWTYDKTEFSSYQKEATLVFVHDDEKLCLVELQ